MYGLTTPIHYLERIFFPFLNIIVPNKFGFSQTYSLI